MLAEPKCSRAKCRHFLGVIQPDGTEETEQNYCVKYPKGIISKIAYGKGFDSEETPKEVKNCKFFSKERE